MVFRFLRSKLGSSLFDPHKAAVVIPSIVTCINSTKTCNIAVHLEPVLNRKAYGVNLACGVDEAQGGCGACRAQRVPAGLQYCDTDALSST